MHTLLLLLCFVSNAYTDPPSGGYYHPKYDYLDLDDVLNHKRLVYHYANCLLSRAPCPPQGMELKEILPEALETTCLRCTEKQRAIVLHVIRRLKREYPDVWKEISDQWDPTGENIQKFVVAFNKENATMNDLASDLLVNRFAEDESMNELAGTLKSTTTTTTTTTPKPTKPKLKPSVSTSIKPTETVHVVDQGYVPITVAPSPLTPWWLNFNGRIPTRFRPVRVIFNAGPSWLGDVSNRVFQAGTQVAGAVLSTVQAAFAG